MPEEPFVVGGSYVSIHEKEEDHAVLESCHGNALLAGLGSSEGRGRDNNAMKSDCDPDHPRLAGWFAEHSPLWPGTGISSSSR